MNWIKRLSGRTNPPNTDNDYGVKELCAGNSVDIVAIHGLDGHREGSWTADNGVLWLRDLLPAYLSKARILTYGYDSATRGKSQLSKQTLVDHAEDLLAKLTLHRKHTQSEAWPLIFIAHSLGGVVLKLALIKSALSDHTHPLGYNQLKLSTHGIIYLGTPHQGIEHADLALMFLRIQSVVRSTNNSLLQQLRQDSQSLQMQLALYESISHHFDTKCLYEVYPTPIFGGKSILLVPKLSAVIQGSESISLNRDHAKLVKFQSSTESDFGIVLHLLQGMVNAISLKVEVNCSQVISPPAYPALIQMEGHMSMAPPPSPIFTGRADVLQLLKTHFIPRAEHLGRRSFLLHGMGAAGKTQVCAKFLHDNVHCFKLIIWVDATSQQTANSAFVEVARHPAAKAMGVEESMESVLQWLSQNREEWLMVLDNADGPPQTLEQYMPPGNLGNIIITTRNPHNRRLVAQTDVIELDDMPCTDAATLLLKAARLDCDDPAHNEHAKRIATELCFLPLAMDQAGSSIAEGLCDIQDYLELYSEHRHELLDDPSFTGASKYGRAVYATFEISFRNLMLRAGDMSQAHLANAALSAVTLIETFAFFHHSNIPQDIFRRAAEHLARNGHDSDHLHDHLCLLQSTKKGGWDSLRFGRGIQLLLSYSLIKMTSSSGMYNIHPLIHSWSRDRLHTSLKHRHSRCRAARRLLAWSISLEDPTRDLLFHQMLVPHIQANTQVQDPEYDEREHDKFARIFHQSRYWKEAVHLWKAVMKDRQDRLGADHLSTLETMEMLARTYADMGQPDAAEALQAVVLETHRRNLGEDHSNTIHSMANIGRVFSDQGRHAEAEQIKILVLKKLQRVFGEDHPDTLKAKVNLARTCTDLGRFDEAEALQRPVLEKRQRHLGDFHPDTLFIMSSLAATYSRLSRHDKALELSILTLENRKVVLGEDHPDTIMSMANLAEVLLDNARVAEALELTAIVLEKRTKILGLEHHLTHQSRMSHARALIDQYTALPPDESSRAQILGEVVELTKVDLEQEEWCGC